MFILSSFNLSYKIFLVKMKLFGKLKQRKAKRNITSYANKGN